MLYILKEISLIKLEDEILQMRLVGFEFDIDFDSFELYGFSSSFPKAFSKIINAVAIDNITEEEFELAKARTISFLNNKESDTIYITLSERGEYLLRRYTYLPDHIV